MAEIFAGGSGGAGGAGYWITPAGYVPLLTVSSSYTSGGGSTVPYRFPLPQEERDRLAAEQRRYLEAYRARHERRKAAEKKAEALFLSCLTGEQKKQLDKDNSFKVIGSGGKNRYIISCSSTVENVYRTRYGKPCIIYCAAPRATSICWDIWLAQKLILESDEPAFLKVAVPSMF